MYVAKPTRPFLCPLFTKSRGIVVGAGRLGDIRLAVRYCERRPGVVIRWKRPAKQHVRARKDFAVSPDVITAPSRSLSLFWNPSKKILYGDNLFVYPMGNTPATDLFDGLSSASSALLLGCGDVRNVLETCRESRGGGKLSFALNDFNATTVARAGLLLAIADQIDASNVSDVDFLWGVWYNLQLPEEHFLRLRKVVREILDSSGEMNAWLNIRGRDWAEVENVYRSWDVDGSSLPAVGAVEEMRKKKMLEHLSPVPDPLGLVWPLLVQQLTDPSIEFMENKHLKALAKDECSTYAETGSVSRGTGDVDCLTNVTLLDPESRQWRNHYGSSPFPTYRTIIHDENVNDAGGLVKACQHRLQEWVVALQKRTRQEAPNVDISLHCSDALEFCVREDNSRSFDVIDSTNLADHVGLLNLVVCAGPRLTNKAASRLYTSTLTWTYETDNLCDYLRRALSFDFKFAPTILGLRLLTDPELGKSSVDSLEFVEGPKERRLAWEPVLSPSPPITINDGVIKESIQSDQKLPHQPEPCAIGVQVGEILKTCCLLPLAKAMPDRCGFRLSSPATLALILRNMSSRCLLHSSGDTPDGSFTEWCRKYCMSFGLEAEKVARLMDPSRGGLVEVRGQLCRDEMEKYVKSTPIVRVGLVHRSLWDDPSNLEVLNSALGSNLEVRHSPDMSLVHVMDNALVSDDFYVQFLLPVDHGLDSSEWEVLLLDLDRPFGISVHSNASLGSMEQIPFVAPTHAVNKGLARDATHTNGLRILNLMEYDDRFVADVSCDVSVESTTFFSEFCKQNPADGASTSVKLGFQLTTEQKSLQIAFPSPVVAREPKLKGNPSGQQFECNFPKSSVWPTNPDGLELLDISSLPRYKSERALFVMLQRMFNCQERMHKIGGDSQGISSDPFFDLRETIQIIFSRVLKDNVRIHILYGSLEHAKAGHDPIISLAVTGSVNRMDDGKPAVLVSYVDFDQVKALKKAGRLDEKRFASQFLTLVNEVGGKGESVIKVGEEEVKMLKKILSNNSSILKPSGWQAKHVAAAPEWRPSFITPLFPENVKTGKVGSRELREKVKNMTLREAFGEVQRLQLEGHLREADTKADVKAAGRLSRGFAAAPQKVQKKTTKEKKRTGKKRKP